MENQRGQRRMEVIPNNVALSADKALERRLLQWQACYLDWWRERGPEGLQASDVYLRTAKSVGLCDWARYGHVRMPDYRWGIFLAPEVPGRVIACGDDYGQPVWQTPDAHRDLLWRLIAVQGDTEPGSVEQQRLLGKTAPSLYDLRNLLQVNVEEGRHLWAMAYLLHRYFGRDGQEESMEMLRRRSGSPEKGRLLEAFNEPCEDWLSFFMFTMFADRDGKYQLAALAESGFDPLSRTTRFMLTEEAHHLFVGESGIERVITRTAALMQQGVDVAKAGGIPLDVIQRYINRWFPTCLDLFGSETSSKAAEMFATGVKGRYKEASYSDHIARDGTFRLFFPEGESFVEREIAQRRAMNEILRDEYVADCERAVTRWNRVLWRHGQSDTLSLPHRRFNRRQGIYAGHSFDPQGNPLMLEECTRGSVEWLPSDTDRAFVHSLMVPVREPGKVANWIAPPCKGPNGQPLDYQYVRL